MRFWSVFVALLILLSTANAAVRIMYPVVGSATGDESFYIGRVSPGHRILIVTDRGPEDDPWTEARIDRNWDMTTVVSADRLYIYVDVPKDASGTQQFCITVFGNASMDRFCPSVLVTPNLVEFYVQNKEIEAEAGGYATVPVLLINKSVGMTEVEITCSLGEKHCETVREKLIYDKKATPEIKITYPFPGTYDITVTMKDLLSGTERSEKVRITFTPSIGNDFKTLRWGMPVSAPLLLPIMALLSVVG